MDIKKIDKEIAEMQSILELEKHITKWLKIGSIALIILIIYFAFSDKSQIGVYYELEGNSVGEMLADYQSKSGKTLSTWFCHRIGEKCEGKNREECEKIINTIGASAPINNK